MSYPYPNSVAEAAQILDNDNPGWYNKVDTDTLDMLDFKKCVLGQAYGAYGDTRRRLMGENLCHNGLYLWASMDEEWITEIKKRKGEKSDTENAIQANVVALQLSADLLKLLPSRTVINDFLGNGWFVWTTKIGDKEWNSHGITKMSRYKYHPFNGLELDQTVNY